jgi:PadR family transcriptional regulator, regulatory protein PadR
MGKIFGKELKRGTLEMILLKLLIERPMYGYELVSTLEQRGGARFQIKEGTLYPVLYRLEDAGLIQPEWETPERGVPRKYYHITPAGSQQLETLLAEWHEFTKAVGRLLSPENID